MKVKKTVSGGGPDVIRYSMGTFGTDFHIVKP